MPEELVTILYSVAGLAAGLAIGLFLIKPRGPMSLEQYERKAEAAIKKTKDEAEKTKMEVIERVERLRLKNIEDEARSEERFKRIETLLASKEEQLGRKEIKVKEIKQVLDGEAALVEELRLKSQNAEKLYTEKLAEKTGQNTDQIKAQMLETLQRELELEREDRLHRDEERLNEEKERIAKNMITDAIQRYSGPTSVEKRATSITVERDEMKGRLLGKNGENIRLLEELTEVDIIFNDAPNTIIISCFDLVKKHVAREAINKLMRERVVTPDKVRFKVKEAEQETEKTLVRNGQDIIKKLELEHRNLPPEFARIMGRLQFRTSYGQNIFKHSFEVGNFTVMLGSELGLNIETCKVAGFFHDLGKAIDQEVGGSHDVLTKEIMEKYGFSEEEIHAAWTHHDSLPQKSAEALLVKAGDAISATRPGARQESIEKYLERIRALESISTSYEGVSKAYAISAGREVRVIVEPARLSDSDLRDLAKNIATEIQENVGFPGKIKINVIRRTLNTDYANRIPGPSKPGKKNTVNK